MLDMLLVRARIVGVELNLIQSDLTDLAAVRPGTFQLAYAAQATHQLDDIVRFYSETFRILGPTCRLVINEYHPIRRIWKQEPGQPRVQHSYFDRRRTRDEEDLVPDPNSPFNTISRYEFNWTISDHCHALLSVGFRIAAIEEVGDVRQKWEIPNMKGLPEQLVIAADRPE
jgi:ubiquinone/menaquinone biosynthesis C-methylase UbiE